MCPRHPGPSASPWPAAVLVWVTALAVLATGGPARGQVPPATGAHVVVDTLTDGAMPSGVEVAASITRFDPPRRTLEPRAPRSLRQEVREGDRTTLVVATDVLFAFDSADLTVRAQGTLRDLAAELDHAATTGGTRARVRVVGHTDSVGSDAYNQQLSERRAEAVATVLAEVLGTDGPITAEGRGERAPVADEDQGGARAAARNRRVEILVEA